MTGFMHLQLARASGQAPGPKVRAQTTAGWQQEPVAEPLAASTSFASFASMADSPATEAARRQPEAAPPLHAELPPGLLKARKRSLPGQVPQSDAPTALAAAAQTQETRRFEPPTPGPLAASDVLTNAAAGRAEPARSTDMRRHAMTAATAWRAPDPQASQASQEAQTNSGLGALPPLLLAPRKPAQAMYSSVVSQVLAARQGLPVLQSTSPAAPVVHVSIGRIDLVVPAPAAAPRAKASVRSGSNMPLADYLRGSSRGSR